MSLSTSLLVARRLAVACQRLNGPRPEPDPSAMLEVIRAIRCLQLDPISAVARSHLLVLWSRLGGYDPAGLDYLLWQKRALFEYWAHAASIVLTEDYPIFQVNMNHRANGGWREKSGQWLANNVALRQQILGRLTAEGALPPGAFEDNSEKRWYSTGWTDNRNISTMLDFLWVEGQIMVSGRSGQKRLWDLTERVLPDWAPRHSLSRHEAAKQAAELALKALGVGQTRHVNFHFTRGKYPNLKKVLAELVDSGRIQPLTIYNNDTAMPGTWYIHHDHLPLLERLENGHWQPRTTLLSPFDNLICDRDRTEKLFNFYFRIEIYVPAAKRQYGYYVLPILHGEQLIGRIDPKLDRKQKKLFINAVHAEPDAPLDGDTGRDIANAVQELATFLGANEVVYLQPGPAEWQLGLSN